jgi:hypothetical protein
MTIRARDFDRLVEKFGFETRDSRDLLAWFVYGGRTIVRTKRSKGGSGDLPMQHAIRQQLKLDEEQLRQAVRCTFSRDDYIELLRSKGLL